MVKPFRICLIYKVNQGSLIHSQAGLFIKGEELSGLRKVNIFTPFPLIKKGSMLYIFLLSVQKVFGSALH